MLAQIVLNVQFNRGGIDDSQAMLQTMKKTNLNSG